MMAAAISVDHVTKIYRTGWRGNVHQALNGVSLEIETGETFGFVGPNGAGKSTLIKILVGVLQPTSGRASLFGQDVCRAQARFGLGFVPENPCLQEHLTPLEILMMAVRLQHLEVSNERSHCLHWLEKLDLMHVANSPLRGFSKGMLQRTALAHALVVTPRLLILDEPLSGLDPVGRRDVVDLLDDYRRSGGTLFFSSHVLYDVERIADRFGLIHQGQLLTIRSPRDIVADQADWYTVRFRADAAIAGSTEIRPGVYAVDVEVGMLPETIGRVCACGGVLQDVRPSVSLENVFFRAIDANPSPGSTYSISQ